MVEKTTTAQHTHAYQTPSRKDTDSEVERWTVPASDHGASAALQPPTHAEYYLEVDVWPGSRSGRMCRGVVVTHMVAHGCHSIGREIPWGPSGLKLLQRRCALFQDGLPPARRSPCPSRPPAPSSYPCLLDHVQQEIHPLRLHTHSLVAARAHFSEPPGKACTAQPICRSTARHSLM